MISVVVVSAIIIFFVYGMFLCSFAVMLVEVVRMRGVRSAIMRAMVGAIMWATGVVARFCMMVTRRAVRIFCFNGDVGCGEERQSAQ